MSSRRKLFFVLGLLAIIGLIGHWFSRKAAIDYGNQVSGSFSMLARSEFKNTASLRELFASPELQALENRTKTLSFLGGDYHHRITELKTGLIYLSEQLALPEQQRLTSPPALKHFNVNAPDRSDEGILGTSVHVLSTFQLKL